MKRFIVLCFICLNLAFCAEIKPFNEPTTESIKNGFSGAIEFRTNEKIYGKNQIEAIKAWGLDSSGAGVQDFAGNYTSIDPLNYGEKIDGIRGISGLGEVFTMLQNKYFKLVFLALIIGVPLAFFGHFIIVGQKKFNHHQKLKVFSKFNIVIHWCAAIPFVIICVTGVIMVFGAYLGGGVFVRFARDIHGLFTPAFAFFGIIMFLMWAKDCLFRLYDIAWLKIMGGYLSRENFPIPAGKFNAGQKMWFWIATIGGAIMVITGAMMFFQNNDINTLRLVAIIHNICGMLILAMLITHIYMALFAIEGAIEAIINGKMGEEELSILHSIYYQELESSGKLQGMRIH